MAEPLTDEFMARKGAEAYERICALAVDGVEVMTEMAALRERLNALELENQRLRFAVITERNLKCDAYNQNHALHLENERLRDLVAGRIERGPVDPKLLLRSVLDVVHSAADREEDE